MTQTDENAGKKLKVIMLKVKFKSNINGVMPDLTGNIDTATIRYALEMQPEELSEGKSIKINEESGCDEKDDDVPGKWHYQKLHIIGAFGDISQHCKWKRWKVANWLRLRSMTIWKG